MVDDTGKHFLECFSLWPSEACFLSVLSFRFEKGRECPVSIDVSSPQAGEHPLSEQDVALTHLRVRRTLNVGLLLSGWALQPLICHEQSKAVSIILPSEKKKVSWRSALKEPTCVSEHRYLITTVLIKPGVKNFTASVFIQDHHVTLWTEGMDWLSILPTNSVW